MQTQISNPTEIIRITAGSHRGRLTATFNVRDGILDWNALQGTSKLTGNLQVLQFHGQPVTELDRIREEILSLILPLTRNHSENCDCHFCNFSVEISYP